MNRLTTILVTIAFLAIAACSGNTSFAQVSASAQATATIVTPMTIEKLNDLEFEQVTRKAAPRSTARRTSGGRKSNVASAATATTSTSMKPASFNVSGYPDYTYGVSVPASVTVSGSSHEFTLDNIAASFNHILSASGKGTVSITGTPSIRAAGTLTADRTVSDDPDEPQGLPVTIIYN